MKRETPFQRSPSSQMYSMQVPCQGLALEMAEMPPATQHEKLQPPGAASRLQQPPHKPYPTDDAICGALMPACFPAGPLRLSHALSISSPETQISLPAGWHHTGMPGLIISALEFPCKLLLLGGKITLEDIQVTYKECLFTFKTSSLQDANKRHKVVL